VAVTPNEDYPGSVAGTLLENGYIEGNGDNLAAYIALMVREGPVESLYKRLKKEFNEPSVVKNMLLNLLPTGWPIPAGKYISGDWNTAVERVFKIKKQTTYDIL
jgi:hypothetical protein